MARAFAITVFVGAALLFLLEPLTGRLVLPHAGGTPAVWTTCLLVYQVLMLAGYAYADAVGRLMPRIQVPLHMVVLGVAVLTFPIALPANAALSVDRPVLTLLPLLLQTIGLPFFALATTAPLMQRWFALAQPKANPYPLYAASNAGSLIGLAAYPFLVEPSLGLAAQGLWWSIGYGIFAVLVLGCAMYLRNAPAADVTPARANAANGTLPWIRWLLLSLAPSSLLMAATSAVTTDITPVPLLWVVPLALYLITFILAFAGRQVVPHWLVLRLAPIASLAVAYVLFTMSTTPWWAILLIHLSGLFVIALACHGELALLKPAPASLTRYYLVISIGGALGGLINAVVAPVLFSRVGMAEYPLMLALAAGLLPSRPRAKFLANLPEATGWRTLLFPLAIAGLAGGMIGLVRLIRTSPAVRDGIPFGLTIFQIPSDLLGGVLFGIPLVLLFLLVDRPRRFAVGLAGLWLASLLFVGSSGPALFYERNFFGPVKVAAELADGSHIMVHGSTLHGRQFWRDGKGVNEPLSYYGRPGPIGDVMRVAATRGPRPVAACGLGAGSVAAYAVPGQKWTFYEIDPTVAAVARDPNLFTYLSDNFPGGANLDVVLGDARLELARAADGSFGVIILDAFSSDSIPVHLLTREAIQMYLSKLAPGGLLTFHVSNRYLELRPVLQAAARELSLAARYRQEDVTADVANRTGTITSIWVTLARTEDDLGPLAGRWNRLPQLRPGFRTWTDDYSNLLSVFQFENE